MKTLFLPRMFSLAIVVVLTTALPVLALDFYPTDVNIIVNGEVGSGEWVDADYEADSSGASAGAMYAMWKKGYQVGSGDYTGTFQFLLHNIEQLTSQEDADYNVFDFYASDDSANPIVTAWIFDGNDTDNPSGTDIDWLNPAGLSGEYPTDLDDRGFLVYNYVMDEYRPWLPEDGTPEVGGYDWDYYWGVYARGGFNNSAYDEGLPLAIDGSNELYEVVYRTSDGGTVRRNIKDPDDTPTSPLIDYFDGELTMVPEPTTMLLLGSGLIGLARFRKKRKPVPRVTS